MNKQIIAAWSLLVCNTVLSCAQRQYDIITLMYLQQTRLLILINNKTFPVIMYYLQPPVSSLHCQSSSNIGEDQRTPQPKTTLGLSATDLNLLKSKLSQYIARIAIYRSRKNCKSNLPKQLATQSNNQKVFTELKRQQVIKKANILSKPVQDTTCMQRDQ